MGFWGFISTYYDTWVCNRGGSMDHLIFTLEFEYSRGAYTVIDQPLVRHRGGSGEGNHLSISKLPEAPQP